MTIAPLPEGLATDARWLAHAIDPGRGLIRFVEMDEASYRAAGFLDDRLLQQPMNSLICPLDAALERADRARDDAAWIFHIGHVGSTLVSRLLGELDSVLAVREPRSLRDLASAGPAQAPGIALGLRRLMARTFAPGQRALVKATSFASEMAPMLIAPGGTALFLFASPGNYIASILAGDNSILELRALHESRNSRLAARGIDLPGFERSDAHRAAVAWACEMTSLGAAADAMPDRRILWADFDMMLADMAAAVERCRLHFGFAAASGDMERIVSGPLMRRYSKALEYDYSPSLRADLLAEARRDHLPDIRDALAALHEAAGSSPPLRQAIERAERGY